MVDSMIQTGMETTFQFAEHTGGEIKTDDTVYGFYPYDSEVGLKQRSYRRN